VRLSTSITVLISGPVAALVPGTGLFGSMPRSLSVRPSSRFGPAIEVICMNTVTVNSRVHVTRQACAGLFTRELNGALPPAVTETGMEPPPPLDDATTPLLVAADAGLGTGEGERRGAAEAVGDLGGHLVVRLVGDVPSSRTPVSLLIQPRGRIAGILSRASSAVVAAAPASIGMATPAGSAGPATTAGIAIKAAVTPKMSCLRMSCPQWITNRPPQLSPVAQVL
jgi:hypothetical protein